MGKTKPRRKSSWDRAPARRAAAEGVLRQAKRLLNDPEAALRMLEEGRAVHMPLRSEAGIVAGLFGAIRRGDFDRSPARPDAEALRDLLAFCRRETDLLADQEASRYAAALLALSARRRDWLRPLGRWRARSHNALRQFRSLLRHLTAAYEVPHFLDSAWTAGLTPDAVVQQGWYLHVARGKNIRTAEGLPFPLTKKQAHHFLQAPDDLDISSAFRWAVVRDLGGDERLVRSILATPIGTDFGAEGFWREVLRFFVAHPGLDPVHHGPIIDYLRHQKFPPTSPERPGQPAPSPPRPNLSMRGRTPESLLRAAGDWHRSLAQDRSITASSWGPSGIPPFACDDGEGEDIRRFEVVELLTAEDLREEGRAMRHCVGSYAGACATGRSSIWSLRERVEPGRLARRATIEVGNERREVVQVRRRLNRWPTDREVSILARWGDAGGPRLSDRLVI
ncbi:PcfJ domain-containing protein [Tautonia plasticadhaerens]|uniref:Uncharacterized protein n=1 Tax=Tautonia plasticadhaerens TaxID=2527974 RepID=A0A518H9R2_9BACT|nr:PcfJ domain-containing protein [Tautonia plasticadhaerens]QDV37595.1 hypothetical protein ElP_55350 [Tautonia plasticadhaerens]